VHGGVLDPDINFISKPFAIRQLASKVRAVLDR
jgi:DNA-binding response OmpR family regulator